MTPTVVPMTSSTATHVLEWSDADLTTLLTLRPDLRAPVPGTVTALAARAGFGIGPVWTDPQRLFSVHWLPAAQ